MSNSHGVADMAYELQTTTGDLLPACVVSTTWPTVPASGLVLAAFATKAYVRAGQQLTYVDQPAISVTLTGSDGTYWLAVTDDTFSAFSGWTRRDGSHYMWRLSATRPSDVDNLLVFSQLTVSGGNITAVSTPSGVTRAEALRALSGLGTMATQNANAVAITGGSATGLSSVTTTGNVGIANATPSYPLDVTGDAAFRDKIGVGRTPFVAKIEVEWTPSAGNGINMKTTSDTNAYALVFNNAAGGVVGSISTTASNTAYNTTSDARLKHAITPLTGALDVIRALNPITHLWKSDGSRGYSFLAHEVQETIPDGGVVTGEPDAVDDEGRIVPQMYDPSKLVPWLTAALQEAMAQVEALTARVAQLEGAV